MAECFCVDCSEEPQKVQLTADRIKLKFKEALGLSSLSEITQEMLDDFERFLFEYNALT